ncbi:MAG: hypothetical protein KA035_03965 [Candidatus Levybacteria bacterium]|nr:hypothetical protein [Candidatus Levybacteria bacterium]
MNKKIGVIAGAVILVILAVIGFFVIQNANKSQTSLESTSNMEPKSVSAPFESLQDVFTNKNLNLVCEFTSEGGQKTAIYVKNGMVRTSSKGNTPQEAGDAIIRDNFVYFWNDTSAVKVPFNPQDLESAQQNVQTQQSLSDLEKYKDSCKTAVANDSLFTPPSDIKFQDLSDLMQAMPSGSASESEDAPTQEEIEALMKQYQQSQ